MNLLRTFIAFLVVIAPLAAKPPPQLDDWEAAQLYEGCAVRADSYARRLRELDPSWKVHLESLVLPDGGKHTVAVVERGAERYIRDATVGVTELQTDVQHDFVEYLKWWQGIHVRTSPNANMGYHPPRTKKALENAIEIAVKVLRTKVTRYSVEDGGKKFTVVAWTTVDGREALYDPTIGTAITSDHPKSGKDLAISILRFVGHKNATITGSKPN